MKNDPPCHHCQERYLGCHAECQRYAKYHAWRAGKLAKKHTLNQAIGDMIEIMRDNWKKKRGHL